MSLTTFAIVILTESFFSTVTGKTWLITLSPEKSVPLLLLQLYNLWWLYVGSLMVLTLHTPKGTKQCSLPIFSAPKIVMLMVWGYPNLQLSIFWTFSLSIFLYKLQDLCLINGIVFCFLWSVACPPKALYSSLKSTALNEQWFIFSLILYN